MNTVVTNNEMNVFDDFVAQSCQQNASTTTTAKGYNKQIAKLTVKFDFLSQGRVND